MMNGREKLQKVMSHVIITDLTEMSTGNYCVAGWDWEHQRMVRLLTRNGGNWSSAYVGQTGLWHRRLVRFVPVVMPQGGLYPHATEDTRIDETTMRTFPRPDHWRTTILQSESPNVDAVFGQRLNDGVLGQIRKSPYVPPNTNCASLGAIRANSADFGFYVNDFDPNKPKLRCRFAKAGWRFDLPVSSYRLRLRWREIGVDQMNERQGDFGQVHVRLGFARPFNNACYLMLNGLYRAQDH
jgi:hypothetical protein